MTFLDLLNLPKFDFTQNLSVSKIINLQQSQALTSHFESFWSIVPSLDYWGCKKVTLGPFNPKMNYLKLLTP